jgi:hypothetical protein
MKILPKYYGRKNALGENSPIIWYIIILENFSWGILFLYYDPCVADSNPLWDVGAGLSDETVQTEVSCRSRCVTVKNSNCLKP